MAASQLTLALVGDISLGGDVRRVLGTHGAPFLFEPLRAHLDRADLRLGNLECCFVDPSVVPGWEGMRMAVPAPLGAGLARTGFEVLSLANNHVMDAGPPGLTATRELLDREGIVHFGAGECLEEAERTVFLERGGRRIALLGVCDASYHFAGRTRPGIAPLHFRRLASRVHEAARAADLVVVALHADLEFSRWPSVPRVRYSRWLAEQGAHLIWEHHPHVYQGIEAHRGGLIAYSTGNFVFDIAKNGYLRDHQDMEETFILLVTVSFGAGGPSFRWEAIPARIGPDHRPLPASGDDAEALQRHLRSLTADLTIPSRIQRAWRARACAELRQETMGLYYAVRGFQPGRALQTITDPIFRPQDRRWLLGALSGGRL